MPRPKLTVEEKHVMRERILDAAVCILHEEGPEGLSIRAIAERVGVSHMVLYTYFENRGALFAALHKKQWEHMRLRRAEKLKEAREGDVLAVVEKGLRKRISFALKNPDIFHFMHRSMLMEAHDKGKHPPPLEHDEIKHVAALIQIGIERGVMVERDPTLAALMVGGMMNGTLATTLLSKTAYEYMYDAILEEIVQTAMDYLTGQ